MKYYDFHCLIAEYECLLDAAEASLRRFDEDAALFEEESTLFRLELEALIGVDMPLPRLRLSVALTLRGE